MIKLNLGCGDWRVPGFIGVDLYHPDSDVKADVRSLPYADNSVDEIYSSHVIEHFDFHEGQKVLREWYRVLKPGGWMATEQPDLEKSCAAFLNADEKERVGNLYPHFFGMPWLPGGAHKFIYTFTQFKWTVEGIGFKNVHQAPAVRYINKEHISMKVICQK